MKSFNFKLITPEKTVFDNTAEGIAVLTGAGQITVYADHEHMVTVVVPGELIVEKDGERISFVVGQGSLSINNNSVELLTNTTETLIEIDLTRAEEAIARAKQVMKGDVKVVDLEYMRMEALIARNLARVKVKTKYH